MVAEMITSLPSIEPMRISVETTIEMVSDIDFIEWFGILSVVLGLLALNLVTRYRRTLEGGYCQACLCQASSHETNHHAMTRDQLVHALRTVILAASLFEQVEIVQNWVNSNPRLKANLDQAQQAILSGHIPEQVVNEFSTYLVQTLSQVRPPPYYEELLAHLNAYKNHMIWNSKTT